MKYKRQNVKKSRALCIIEGDYKTVYYKWLNAQKRWKDYWYEGFMEIYEAVNQARKSYDVERLGKQIYPHEVCITEDSITFRDGASADYEKGKELLYWIDLDTLGGEHIYYKVGTTTRPPKQRMIEHLNAYEDESVSKVVVHRVVDCGNIPAEGFESYIRAMLIAKYPNAFKSKDRFVASSEVVITAEEVDKWIADYFKLSTKN